MPNNEEHSSDSYRKCGVSARDLHRWMDTPSQTHRGNHQRFRHNPDMPPPLWAIKKYGYEKARKVQMAHIRLDGLYSGDTPLLPIWQKGKYLYKRMPNGKVYKRNLDTVSKIPDRMGWKTTSSGVGQNNRSDSVFGFNFNKMFNDIFGSNLVINGIQSEDGARESVNVIEDREGIGFSTSITAHFSNNKVTTFSHTYVGRNTNGDYNRIKIDQPEHTITVNKNGRVNKPNLLEETHRCKKCHLEIEADSNYCKHCGEKIG